MAKTYESFSEGYTQVVKPFLKKRPHAESVDGKTVRKKRRPSALFRFRLLNRSWFFDKDTSISGIKIAYKLLRKGEDPFLLDYTETGRGIKLCLRKDIQAVIGESTFYCYCKLKKKKSLAEVINISKAA